ncbi:MAG TPA: hypothetical protein VJL58_10750, partial [Pyrinomonadaceae bacterium]|nr:hypothetical protein [Pyrinomonadaceae bacterium]
MKWPSMPETENEPGVTPDRNRVRVVSLMPDVCSMDSVVQRILTLIKRGGGYACFSTVHMVMESHDDAAFAQK